MTTEPETYPPFFVPTVEQWAAMTWPQRRLFCQRRFVTRTVWVECEKNHVSLQREVFPAAAGIFSEAELARLRRAIEEDDIRRNPHPDADRHWNELAASIGALNELRTIPKDHDATT